MVAIIGRVVLPLGILAISLGFGILFATLIVLVLIPALLLIHENVHALRRARGWS